MFERPSRRQYVQSIGTALAIGTFAGCTGGGGNDGGGGTTVDMTDDLTFEPATLSVAVGDTVTWRTVGSVGHTVTAYEAELPSGAAYFASGGFESEAEARRAYPDGNVPGGDSYEHTFETPGTYPYFCIPHERTGMKGTIEVAEE